MITQTFRQAPFTDWTLRLWQALLGAWCLSWLQLAFLGYGQRWLRCSNAALVYLREAGYPIYILHQPLIVVIAWFVVPRDWTWQVKYLAVFGSTLVLCFAIYEGLVRRWRLARVLFGLKRTAPVPAGEINDSCASSARDHERYASPR